jgi:protein-L-isoaspartate(D-aspartate) O-methyltransferase
MAGTDRDMNADFSELRTKMVDGQLRTTDVTDPAILDAMFAVPREAFVDEKRRPLAYIDEDIEIAPARPGMPARYLMEPSPFAKLLQLAEIGSSERVLDVGAGCGYSSAVLSRLAGSVIALESDAALAERARVTLAGTGNGGNVTVVVGQLDQGHAAGAPYDVILIEGAVERLPEALLSQLREGGRLVAVEGHGNAGIARLYLRTGGSVTGRRAFNAAVKPLPGFERTASFEF